MGVAPEWYNTEDGRSAGNGEPWGATRIHRAIEPWEVGRGRLMDYRGPTGHKPGNKEHKMFDFIVPINGKVGEYNCRCRAPRTVLIINYACSLEEPGVLCL